MAKSEKEMIFLHHLEDIQNDLNVIIERNPPRLNSSYIFTAADCKHAKILQLMEEHGISEYEVFGTKSEPTPETNLRRGNFVEKIDDAEIVTKKYLDVDEGNEYMSFMAERINQNNPKVSATIQTEAQTYENREINSIRIEYVDKPDNPVIFIDSGIHAREWHARSMGLFLLAKLAEEAALGENGILFKATFVIVPRLLLSRIFKKFYTIMFSKELLLSFHSLNGYKNQPSFKLETTRCTVY
jgi:Zinc carboxypeptidase